MGFIDNMKSKAEATREGRRKAERDIDLVTQFIDVHNGKPDYEIAKRFFSSLGDDVRPGPETVSYMKHTEKFQTYVRESGLIDPKGRPPSIVGATVIDLGEINMDNLPQILASFAAQVMNAGGGLTPEAVAEALWSQRPDLTPEDVDEIAAEHGHNTRDDECPALRILREKIAERDGR